MENITIELLNMWKENPHINPLTKRKIKINGPTYKKLKKMLIVKIGKNKFAQTKSIVFNYIEFRKNKIETCRRINSLSSSNFLLTNKLDKVGKLATPTAWAITPTGKIATLLAYLKEAIAPMLRKDPNILNNCSSMTAID